MKLVTDALNEILLDTQNSTGGSFRDGFRSLTAPIDLSSAMEFESEDPLAQYHSNKYERHRYSRDSNNTSSMIEAVLSQVNNGKTICFTNGMAAVWSTLWTLSKTETKIYTIGCFYRKTLGIIDDFENRKILKHTNFTDENQLHNTLTKQSRGIIFIESPSNPMLRVNDVKKIRENFPHTKIVYDNTASGLANERFDLSNQVDYVVSSATKYISGHNDLLAGYVTTFTNENYEELWSIRSMQGGLLNPFSSYLLLRSLKTYDLRFKAQCENALMVMEELSEFTSVEKIYYPGHYENIDQNQIAMDLYYHFGSMVTFTVDPKKTIQLNNQNLLSSKMAPSFGSTDTLIERPATMSHHGKNEKDLQEIGLTNNLIRLSVGLENPDYILADLRRALN